MVEPKTLFVWLVCKFKDSVDVIHHGRVKDSIKLIHNGRVKDSINLITVRVKNFINLFNW